VTVGLTVIPQSLAYATLAGLEPQVWRNIILLCYFHMPSSAIPRLMGHSYFWPLCIWNMFDYNCGAHFTWSPNLSFSVFQKWLIVQKYVMWHVDLIKIYNLYLKHILIWYIFNKIQRKIISGCVQCH
jgi:hypothetical protein